MKSFKLILGEQHLYSNGHDLSWNANEIERISQVWFHLNLRGLFNAKVILLEQ